MQYLLDIKDEKSEPIESVLNDLDYVKIEPIKNGKSKTNGKSIKNGKSKLYNEISESVDELIEVLAGRKEARPLSDLLNEV
jgi:hypothetical protein